MASNETVLLKSTLEVQGKVFSVKLTLSEIYWEALAASGRTPTSGPYSEPLVKTENQNVKLQEVIAVHTGDNENKYDGKFHSVELQSLSPTCFSIWVIKRVPKHRWRERKLTFHSRDTHVVQQWVTKIRDMLADKELKRPQSLLVFVNPYGGKGKAPQVFREKVAPLFDLAGVKYEAVTTLRANHARDTLLEYDLSKVDGVACVGGDGMFVELLHGLMKRTHHDNGMDQPGANSPLLRPQLRIGIIPAGSTDTVIYSMQGSHDPVTSALHIILGDSIAMDVATVHHGNQFLRYNVSLLGYGFYGDCLLESEKYRWMGPKRYDFAGAKIWASNQAYEGEVSYLPSPDRESHPRDRTSCKAGCSVCSAAARNSQQDQTQEIDITVREEEEEDSDLNQPLLCNNNGPADRKWQTIRGRFLGVSSFVISCRCGFSPEGPMPAAHLGDGCVDLVIIKECSRTDFFKHLYRCTQVDKDQFAFPFIHVVRVREYRFRPLVDDTEDSHDAPDNVKMDSRQRLRSRALCQSVWNCDGEVVEEAGVDVRVHQQAIKIFGRGIEDLSKKPLAGCLSCMCRGEQ